MQLSERIRTMRVEQGRTLKVLSRRCGTTPSYLSDLEHGRAEPSLSMLRRLAVALGTTVVGVLEEVDGFGAPLLPDLTVEERTQLQDYLTFLRWRQGQRVAQAAASTSSTETPGDSA